LKRFWEAGADLIIFSGGKSIMGPQSTGLVIGRKDLIAGCAANGVPFATVGRPMKVSREEMVGFMTALELYLARDHEADTDRWTAQLNYIEAALKGIPNITTGRLIKSETYTIPLLYIRPEADANFTRSMIADALEAGEPPIVVGQHFTEDSVTINPHNLQPGQEQIVAERCKAVLAQIG
jgi:L-seryl-tRNA(Ser) seleniumtransferase